MNGSQTDLGPAAIISMIESGAYPRDTVLTIARGFLPLEQKDLIAVLAYLGISSDEEVRLLARESLREMPSHVLTGYAADPEADPAHLSHLAQATDDRLVLEALVRNRTLPDEAVVELARRAESALQDVIVINQERTLRTPEILDALLANPQVTPDARRRALETREEFFDKKARIPTPDELIEEAERQPIPLDGIADLLEKAALEPPPDAPTLPPPDVEARDDPTQAIWTRLGFMSVSEKVKLAFRGDRMVRMFLVRDRNRLVCSAVMRNPRMTEQEVELIAGMRNVDDEVLRLVGMRRDWMSKYNVIVTLCRNPKVPVGVVLPLINRLTLRDLKGLKDDRGVTQVVREAAKRFYLSRTQKK